MPPQRERPAPHERRVWRDWQLPLLAWHPRQSLCESAWEHEHDDHDFDWLGDCPIHDEVGWAVSQMCWRSVVDAGSSAEDTFGEETLPNAAGMDHTDQVDPILQGKVEAERPLESVR